MIGPEYVLPKLWTMKCSLPALFGTMKFCGAESITESGPYSPVRERLGEREHLERRARLAVALGGEVELALVPVAVAAETIARTSPVLLSIATSAAVGPFEPGRELGVDRLLGGLLQLSGRSSS